GTRLPLTSVVLLIILLFPNFRPVAFAATTTPIVLLKISQLLILITHVAAPVRASIPLTLLVTAQLVTLTTDACSAISLQLLLWLMVELVMVALPPSTSRPNAFRLILAL